MTTQKTIQLTKKISVKIMATGPNVNLDEELYAVNWFDLKRPRLYEFYNQLAYPHVKMVEGKVYFKGEVIEKIKGPDENDRQMLLIVNYPSANHFLKMVSNKMFILKSVFRIKAVDFFTFGFTKRMGGGPKSSNSPTPYEGDHSYLLHTYQTKSSPSKFLYEVEELIAQCGLKVHYMGFKAAIIGRSSNEQKLRTQPFLMDGLSLIETDNKDQFDQLLEHADFLKLTANNLSNNFYLIKRII